MAVAYDAWRESQPQLFLTDEVLWPDGLDEPQPNALRFVEPVPAASPYPPSGGGLETTRLTAEEVEAASRHEAEGCYPLPDSQSSVGLSGRKGKGSHSDGLAPFPASSAVSLVLNPGAEPCRDNGDLTAGIPSPPDPDSSLAAASLVGASAPPFERGEVAAVTDSLSGSHKKPVGGNPSDCPVLSPARTFANQTGPGRRSPQGTRDRGQRRSV